jgi:hypothetical protein
MFGADNNRRAGGLQVFVDQCRDGLGHPFLDLRLARNFFYHARDFA